MDLSRRSFTAIIATSAIASASAAFAQEVDKKALLNDPETPNGGNPKGDVTMVAFLDYNCPYCKKTAPDLVKAVREDGNVRVVYKDWPVITKTSVFAAQLALAAAYQGEYERVHHALMAAPGRKLSNDQFVAAVRGSGVDMNRLELDINQKADKILALLRRTMGQAEAIGLPGTPSYLVGSFSTSTLDYDSFKQAFAEARRRQAG